MSAWERTRNIPWSRIEQIPAATIGGEAVNPDDQRERIIRSLQKEAAAAEQEVHEQEERERKAARSGSEPEVEVSLVKKNRFLNGVPWSSEDFVKHMGFGILMGSITGAVFGFMDGMRLATESKMLKKASTGAKVKFMVQGVTRSGLIFGGFFGGFHSLKYGVRVVNDPGDVGEIVIAGALSMGAMVVKPATRPSLPYAGMLILMEAFSMYMRGDKKAALFLNN